jgi:hypothetical protein
MVLGPFAETKGSRRAGAKPRIVKTPLVVISKPQLTKYRPKVCF